MKKERLLEISYRRLMRYIVFAYLLRRTRTRVRIRAHIHTIIRRNQHMHYVLEEFSRSVRYTMLCIRCPRARCALAMQPIDHTNQIQGTRIDTAVINNVQQ